MSCSSPGPPILPFLLRTEDVVAAGYGLTCIELGVLSAVIIPVTYLIVTIYSRYWPFASLDELLLLCGATVVGVGISVIAASLSNTLLSNPAPYMPRSVPFLFALTALVVTGAAARRRAHVQLSPSLAPPPAIAQSTFLSWARARRARSSPRNCADHPQLNMDVVGFIDDDDAKRGMRIHGLPVLGNRFEIPRLIQRYSVRQVIIALPSAPGTLIREVMKICADAARAGAHHARHL